MRSSRFSDFSCCWGALADIAGPVPGTDAQAERLAAARKYWDGRASTFGRQAGKNSYIERLIGLLGLDPNASVLDMGCATGTLAIPLGRAGHKVMACDFSPKMIEMLNERLPGKGLPVETKLMAWEDDWDAHGVGENSVDVAVASRSMSSGDLSANAAKLDRSAREFAAVTLSGGHVPACEPRLMTYLGREVPKVELVSKLIGILLDNGRYPHIDYIPCERPMCFADRETAIMEFSRLAGKEPLTQHEQDLFDEYADQHFKEEQTDEGTVWQLDYTLIAPWTFIRWSTKGAM